LAQDQALSPDLPLARSRRHSDSAMALNWPGLFAWSTKYHDGTAPSKFTKMSDEDRKFLEQAMEEAFGKVEDPNKVFMEAIAQIKSEDRTNESMATALEVMDRLCDDPDVARNVEKLDGLQALLDMVVSVEGSVRIRGLEILALLFSNNPNIQEAGIKRGAMGIFLKLTREAEKASDERSKAFRALIALVRSLVAHETTLLRSEGGVALLAELLDPDEDPRTREKAANFITSMACNGESLKKEDVNKFAVIVAPLLVSAGEQNVQYREVMASCALELARLARTSCPPALAEAAEARLAAAKASAEKEEGDNGQEEDALQECLAVLSKEEEVAEASAETSAEAAALPAERAAPVQQALAVPYVAKA